MEVQHRIEALKATLAALKEHSSPSSPVLRQNVLDAERALSRTEEEFLELTTIPADRSSAEVFFEDLHRTYDLTSKELQAGFAARGRVAPVAYQKSSGPQDAALEAAVLRALEQNELAYDAVADTQSLTFDLDVRSVPEGAEVSYGRRGDSSFTPLQDQTNSVIKGLPYAVWQIRFVKEGYVATQREHNPFTDKNHVLTVELVARNKKSAERP